MLAADRSRSRSPSVRGSGLTGGPSWESTDGLRRRLRMYHAFAMFKLAKQGPGRGMIPSRLLATTAAVAFAVGFFVEGERALVERCRSGVAVCPIVTLEAPERRVETLPVTQESTDRSGRVPEGQ